MAKMIPATLPVQTESKAERRLFSVLRNGLDDSFTVFHSFNLLTQNKQGKFIDGEIDYLIFPPSLGFLVLEVKGYLNEATLANLSEVQIIHGIGTGTVRQIVRDFLAGHPLVRSFRTGNKEEGGDGVTVASL